MSQESLGRIGLDDFHWLQARLAEVSGNVLEDSRRFLAENRLAPLLWRHRIPGFSELFQALRGPAAAELTAEVMDSLTGSDTWFFRDVTPFEQLRTQILPGLLHARAAERRLAFWSAGCSTGQEPYSLAMMLRQHFPELAGWRVGILATDYSPNLLARAEQGLYSREEVNRGLPAALLPKHFTQEGTHWRLSEDIRGMVRFRTQRLDQEWEPPLPTFDVILMRNVAVYFDPATRSSVLSRLAGHLAPDGSLFLGVVESAGEKEGLARVQTTRGTFFRRHSQSLVPAAA